VLLRAAGWAIVARNAYVERDEIDLIAVEPNARDPDAPGTLVFVEVRSRTAPGFGAPEESVDARKVCRIYRAAISIMRSERLPGGGPLPGAAWRVDLLTMLRDGDDDEWHIGRHIRGLAPR
jgi:Holliday junction resolvase-like predicted endonuclease